MFFSHLVLQFYSIWYGITKWALGSKIPSRLCTFSPPTHHLLAPASRLTASNSNCFYLSYWSLQKKILASLFGFIESQHIGIPTKKMFLACWHISISALVHQNWTGKTMLTKVMERESTPTGLHDKWLGGDLLRRRIREGVLCIWKDTVEKSQLTRKMMLT